MDMRGGKCIKSSETEKIRTRTLVNPTFFDAHVVDSDRVTAFRTLIQEQSQQNYYRWIQKTVEKVFH